MSTKEFEPTPEMQLFEVWMHETYPNLSLKRRKWEAGYFVGQVHSKWKGWEARAAQEQAEKLRRHFMTISERLAKSRAEGNAIAVQPDECRKAFEFWYFSSRRGAKDIDYVPESNKYRQILANDYWKAWQAAWRPKRESSNQWQPIETAPKDGTEILVFSPERPPGKGVSLVFWQNEAWTFFETGQFQMNIEDYLTHWMALPVPPVTQAEGEKA